MTEPKYGVWGDQPPARFCVTLDEHYEDCVRDPEAYGYTKEQAIAQLRYVHLEGSETMTDQEIAESEERYERALARAERSALNEEAFKSLPSLSELTTKMSSEMNRNRTASILAVAPERPKPSVLKGESEGIEPYRQSMFTGASSPPDTYELLARIEKLEAQVQQLQGPQQTPESIAEFVQSYNEQYEYDPKAMLEDFYWPPCRAEGFSPAAEYRVTREGRKIEQPKNPLSLLITETFTPAPESQKQGRGSRATSAIDSVKYNDSVLMQIAKKQKSVDAEEQIVTYKVKRAPQRKVWYMPAGVERAQQKQALIDYDRAMKVVK